MVHLLGRAGKIKEAWNFIENRLIGLGIMYMVRRWVIVKFRKTLNWERATNKLFELMKMSTMSCLRPFHASASKWWNGVSTTHPQSKRIYNVCFGWRMCPTQNLIHDVEDDNVQEQLLNSHSEKCLPFLLVI